MRRENRMQRAELVVEITADEEAHRVRAAARIHSVLIAMPEVNRRRRSAAQHVERREAVEIQVFWLSVMSEERVTSSSSHWWAPTIA